STCQSRRSSVELLAASDDGTAFGITEKNRQFAWLGPDLLPLWEQSLSENLTALAIDSHGEFLAIADLGNRLHLLTRKGKLWTPPIESSRPIRYLSFVPTAPILLAAADFGLVTAFDFRTRQWAWTDNPVVHVGGLACDGEGQFIGIACYSEGIRRYSL